MKVVAGSIVILAGTILGSAGVLRSGLVGSDRDLISMSILLAFGIGLFGLGMIVMGWRDERR